MLLNNPDAIYNSDLKELWNMVLTIDEDTNGGYKREIKIIKEGINLKIPIAHLIREHFTETPKNREIVMAWGDIHETQEFQDEIEARETLMRQIIKENLDDEGLTQPE